MRLLTTFLNKVFLRERHVCPWWFTCTFDNPLRRLVHDPRKILGPYVKSGQTVMDIGAGFGFFSLGMARLAGAEGKVVAVDIQERSLRVLARRAAARGLAARIELCLARPDRIGYGGKVDFALAFWMAHEVVDRERFFREVASLLRSGARFLLVEPKVHVTGERFDEIAAAAVRAGLKIEGRPKVTLSRAVLFRMP
ncbi:MAG: class I SAM-dependent methyltransferase [Endomicrobiales bacterium]